MDIQKFLKWTAILGVVFWLSYEGYRHFAGMGPGDILYIDGNNIFKDGEFERSADYFKRALEENPKHQPALVGLTNSYIQLKRFPEALTTVEEAIRINPKFAGNYATRGIIFDHLGKYELAIADYEKSLTMDPEIADGMHWLTRLLYNVQQRPPTVADRLGYLKKQMSLPASQRRLRNPELDGKQRPYEQ